MADEVKRPIIIRRKVVKASGHHGGAWKVAYADFVTAMMAFFLLMWLLNATTEEQRKGLADYFNPSIPVHRTSGGGDGPFGGKSIAAEKQMSQIGTGATRERPSVERLARGVTGTETDQNARESLEGVADALLGQSGESTIADRLLEHVRLRRTDEGLVIELADLPGRPLFVAGGAEPTEPMRQLIDMVSGVIARVTNPVALDAHLEQAVLVRPAHLGWEVTSQRALVVRDLMAAAGTRPLRFARVSGEADRAAAYPDPRDLRNRRIEVILLHGLGES